MDRRTLLALALTAMAVMIFQVLYFAPAEKAAYAKKQKALLAQRAADSLGMGASEVSDTTAIGISSSIGAGAGIPNGNIAAEAQGQVPVSGALPAGGFVNVAGATLQDITVETDLYEATFSSRGGTLTAMKLKRFVAGKDGEPVNLVRDPEKGEIGLVLKSQKGQLDLSSTVFSVSDSLDAKTGRIRRLTFLAVDDAGASVRKTFIFKDGSYVVGLEIELRGISSQQEKLECLVGWRGGLSLTETNMKEELRSLATVSLLGTEMFRDDIGSFKKVALKEHSGSVRWTAVRSRYFIAAFIPPEGTVSTVLSFGDPQKDLSGALLAIPLSASGVTQTALTLYLGPLDLWKVKALGVGLDRTVNLGWNWIRPVSQSILWFLVESHKLLPNYGLVIILLSALTKILFYPLTRSSTKSMREMQKLQPEIQKLREKLKKDPQKLNKEVMGLYKKHKVNPLGGCLPLLLQMPVFIALYNVLMSSIEMRRANFVWWITDLSSADTVAVVSGVAIHVLPLIMGASMFWQQKMTPTDPRQAAMTYFMPVLMIVFFYSLPSGLVLYWTANNFMTIAQQYMMQRGEKNKQALELVADEHGAPAVQPAS
ncbi:MAG: membrane protein insertase YidC [Candidatus Eisenbacteria bacterium]|nr:membrane protein insertase YidC [Candidatus Eisenbacteria bacterium]